MKTFFILLATVVLLAGSGVMAQQDEGYQDEYRDILEAAIYGGLNMPMGGVSDWTTETPTGPIPFAPKTGFSLGGEFGYFATPNIVTGVQFLYSQYAIDSDNEAASERHHRVFAPAVYLKYYFFGESNFVPYLKAHAGVDFLKFTTSVVNDGEGGEFQYRELSYDPAFAFGFGGGLFYYTHDYGGLFLEVNYHTALTDEVEGSFGSPKYVFGENLSYVEVHAGIKVFFGSE